MPAGAKGYIQSVENVGRVLALFAVERPVVRVSEVSRDLDVDPSTASRLLSTLARTGLVVRDEGGAGYRPGPTILRLAPLVAGKTNLRACASQWMRSLNAASRETVALHVRLGSERVCIDVLPSPQELRSVVEVGAQRPLHAGAPGKVLLAYMSPPEIELYLQADLRQLTKQTLTDPGALRAELARIRATGFALSFGESTPGVSSLAVPVFDWSGSVVASLTCTGPSSRWTRSAMRSSVDTVKTAASGISRDLGHRAEA